MSWKVILKNDDDFKFDEDVFEEIKIVLKELTGEDWNDIFGRSKLTVEEQENSESSKLLSEYIDENSESWHHESPYTPHLLRWLKERLQ